MSFSWSTLFHRDLKPLNMLLTNQRKILKLCDFGTARTKASHMTDNRGSISWMAPEVMLGIVHLHHLVFCRNRSLTLMYTFIWKCFSVYLFIINSANSRYSLYHKVEFSCDDIHLSGGKLLEHLIITQNSSALFILLVKMIYCFFSVEDDKHRLNN